MATARYYNEDKDDGSQHIYGVPKRDLTDAEFEALPKWLKAQVDDSPLYRKTAPPKAAGAAEKPVEAKADKDAANGTRNITQGTKEA
jgi:hypothetical protein